MKRFKNFIYFLSLLAFSCNPDDAQAEEERDEDHQSHQVFSISEETDKSNPVQEKPKPANEELTSLVKKNWDLILHSLKTSSISEGLTQEEVIKKFEDVKFGEIFKSVAPKDNSELFWGFMIFSQVVGVLLDKNSKNFESHLLDVSREIDYRFKLIDLFESCKGDLSLEYVSWNDVAKEIKDLDFLQSKDDKSLELCNKVSHSLGGGSSSLIIKDSHGQIWEGLVEVIVRDGKSELNFHGDFWEYDKNIMKFFTRIIFSFAKENLASVSLLSNSSSTDGLELCKDILEQVKDLSPDFFSYSLEKVDKINQVYSHGYELRKN